MKLIGIDYGTKRVGVALSDAGGTMAFPKMVLPNDRNLLSDLVSLIKKEQVEGIVIGESKNHSGEDNAVMAAIRTFVDALSRECDVPVHYEPEFYTSHEARQRLHDAGKLSEDTLVDASAAAIILESYLNRKEP